MDFSLPHLEFAVFVIDEYFSPRIYSLPWDIKVNVSTNVFAVCLSRSHFNAYIDGEFDTLNRELFLHHGPSRV